MKIVTPAQMNDIDHACINEFGIPGIVLMENAALKVVEEAVKNLGDAKGKRVLVFAGKGNNGGDAFAAARHLYNKGSAVKVYITALKKDVGGDAAINLNALEKSGVEVKGLISEEQLAEVELELLNCELVIDGIFGTGFRGEAKGVAAGVITRINNSNKPVISIDIPSGLNGETGRVNGICVKADKTVTFGLPKIGLLIHPGCEYVGQLIVADIGIPRKVIEGAGLKTNLIEQHQVTAIIPRRRDDSNKGDYGKVLLVSGSPGMTGSGCLAAAAALRTGAGLVYMGVPQKLAQVYGAAVHEPVIIPLEDKGTGSISVSCIPTLLKAMKGKSIIAAGPGLSASEDVVEAVRELIANAEVPLVLDADALNAISTDLSMLKRLNVEAVITPHPGEMARLAGMSVSDVQSNRLEVAREFSSKWNVITVLKGSRTVVAKPDGTLFINTTGNSGMATGGAGDVLTGVIASLAAQGAKPVDAAVAGVYLHGLAGDIAAQVKGEYSLIAGDIVEMLPDAMRATLI
jgi:hydroxyethylthiazole kinase-like uncharacterized protein yjeF